MQGFALQGHQDASIGLDSYSSSSSLLSSSEDGTARIWDLRTLKAARLIKVPGGKDNGVGLCRFTPSGGVILSSSNQLMKFDLRGSDSILISKPAELVLLDDEINSFDICKSTGRILVPTDSGSLTVLDESLNIINSSAEHRNHSSICNVARWMPDGRSAISGGHDYSISQWYEKDGKSLAGKKSTNVNLFSEPDGDGPMVANPPFVNTLELAESPSMGKLVIGLGNGSVVVVDAGEDRLSYRNPTLFAFRHSLSVSGLSWAKYSTCLFWSVGADSVLNLNSIMNAANPSVCISLPSKPNDVHVVDNNTVAVSSVDGAVYLYKSQ